ncbi:hypothetical protein CO662_17000 [Rhizobium anhuiense]|jgi:hypothetical protein|uniref:Uncharacterized protein n=1 Tax=Rhizobium anhuiense TaxID=1184720 RepID=A0A3S0QIT2_9HYPH|nr:MULTISPECIES: hypothetical protein [Rhizobium]MBB4251873.1 hypothetical protein [Rhizobium sp. BK008]PDS42921.1 hypothetical protein CO668_20115 [Rhizobium anhuiense]PDS51046.1 hypothetical protein CO662_17000 [Rhizobium anhuiense]PDS58978.1 hypothetical protein CO663_09250 [Rhizobium anhuiense]RUM04604.1 hypothetical protein EEQ99_03585 [Rhizobium anhuiense]
MIEYTQVQPILFPAEAKKLISQKNAARTTIGHSSPVDRRLKSAIVYDNYMTDHDAADLQGKNKE